MFCLLDALISIDLDKGGLISEILSICLKSPKQGEKSLPSTQRLRRAIFGDLRQSEKLSDIKPPLKAQWPKITN